MFLSVDPWEAEMRGFRLHSKRKAPLRSAQQLHGLLDGRGGCAGLVQEGVGLAVVRRPDGFQWGDVLWGCLHEEHVRGHINVGSPRPPGHSRLQSRLIFSIGLDLNLYPVWELICHFDDGVLGCCNR